MHDLRKNIFLVLVVLFISIFLHSDFVPVMELEAMNFMTAREILQTGSWLIPTLDGEPRIAKPPFPTWITALAIQWAGTDGNVIANRIPAGVCATLLALFTFLLARRVTGDRGFATTSLLVLATSYQFIVSARRNLWEIYALMAMTAALWAMLEAVMRKEGKNLYFLLFSLLMALSFFCKGPVAFWAMLAPFLVSYAIAYGTKDLRENKRGLLWSFTLCLLLSALWPAYVYLSTPHQSTLVALAEYKSWFARYTKPIGFYLSHLHESVGIWLIFLLYGLAVPWIHKDRRPEEKLFALWFVLSLVFLSVFPEKKTRYLLPAVVPGSMVASIAIFRLGQQVSGWAWKLVYGSFSIIMGILFFSAAATLVVLSNGSLWALSGVLPLGFVGGVLIHDFVTKKTRNAHRFAMAGGCLCIVFLAPLVPAHYTPFLSKHLGPNDARMFMHVRQDPELMSREFYALQSVPYSIRWATGKKISLISAAEARTRMAEDKRIALLTTRAFGNQPDRMRLADTITTEQNTYYIYIRE